MTSIRKFSDGHYYLCRRKMGTSKQHHNRINHNEELCNSYFAVSPIGIGNIVIPKELQGNRLHFMVMMDREIEHNFDKTKNIDLSGLSDSIRFEVEKLIRTLEKEEEKNKKIIDIDIDKVKFIIANAKSEEELNTTPTFGEIQRQYGIKVRKEISDLFWNKANLLWDEKNGKETNDIEKHN